MRTPQIKPLAGMTPLGIKPKAQSMTRRFQITFDCENDVFAEDLHNAIADAVLHVSKRVRQHGDLHGIVRDNNGNTIGYYNLHNER